MATFLECVNDVLVRLRESQVTTVTQTTYSTLIGSMVNDTKRRVEDAYNWNALTSSISVTTTGAATYTLTGSGQRFKIVDVLNTGSEYHIQPISKANMNAMIHLGTPQIADPIYYTFDGVDASGDTKVTFYPTPTSGLTIRFDVFVPQATLTTGSTVILVPSDPIVLGAYSLAMAERGEDQGIASSEMTQAYRAALGDAISIESSRHVEFDSWSCV